MRTESIRFANQRLDARDGYPMAPWHREGTRALGICEWRSG
jgi:hypothetical protein